MLLNISRELAFIASILGLAKGFGCGTGMTDLSVVARREMEMEVRGPPAPSWRRQAGGKELTSVNTYIHIMSADQTEEGGNLPDSIIDPQMKIVSDAFVVTGYQFNYTVTRNVNATWYYEGYQNSQIEKDFKGALRKGGVETMNVFVMGTNKSDISAWSTTPNELELPWLVANDGIVIHRSIWLNGSNPELNLGVSLVHEVGHWFGLLHTFSGGCGNFDYVDDTPAQDWQNLGGCEPKDSCPDDPGVDPIHNYMSYSNDTCRTEFTPGQIKRMQEQMSYWRNLTAAGQAPTTERPE
ncbi:hypothetical protein V5O48_013432 [Marasmius crinis-equi]|uniref:Peptidase M43 pregnancy-associated plasma-A domain-containing protein n=1 Tax=Marasmius crinis-equi TaxID=585013 RepID=A0ABR3F032_9AGAR